MNNHDAPTKAVAEVRLGGGLPRLSYGALFGAARFASVLVAARAAYILGAGRAAYVLGAAHAIGTVDAARPPPSLDPTWGASGRCCPDVRLRHPSVPQLWTTPSRLASCGEWRER